MLKLKLKEDLIVISDTSYALFKVNVKFIHRNCLNFLFYKNIRVSALCIYKC